MPYPYTYPEFNYCCQLQFLFIKRFGRLKKKNCSISAKANYDRTGCFLGTRGANY